MTNTNEYGLCLLDAEDPQLKHQIAQDKPEAKNEPLDPGLAKLGTENEAATPPDPEGMAESRRNWQPL